jgi:hypothetical protein
MSSQFIVGFMEVALTVASLIVRFIRSAWPLSGMRFAGASVPACFRKGDGVMVSPSGTRGAGSDPARSGRPTAIAIEEYHPVDPA